MQAALLLLLEDDDDGPGTAIYSYDPNGRLTTVATLGGAALTYAYDVLGNLLNVTSSTNSSTVPTNGSTGPAPAITGFTPAGGSVSTSVTVTGSNFQPVAGQTVVLLGSTTTSPTSISDSQIAFPVPANQGSAPIQVITPYGSATSGVFNVPPAGVTLTSTVSLSVDGAAQTLTLSGAGTAAAYSFNTQVGAWISVQLSSLITAPSGASVGYTLYGPSNQTITKGSVSATAMSIHFSPIPQTGNYLLVFNSGSSTSVSMTGAVGTDPGMAFGGSLTTNVAVAGQSQRVKFAGGQTGSAVVLYVSTQATSPTNQSLTPAYLSSTGIAIKTDASVALGSGTFYGPVATGAVGGILISAPAGVTGTAQLMLDASSTAVTIDGAATNIQSALPGQAMQITFAGTAGQNLVMALTGITTAPTSGFTLQGYLYDPSGKAVTSYGTGTCGANCSWVFPTLASSGQYTLVIAPPDPSATTFSGTLTLSSIVSSTLTANQSASVNLSRPGQTALLTFSSAPAAPMLISITGVTVPSGSSLYAIVSNKGRGDFDTNNSVGNSMIFFVSPAYSSEGPYTLKLAVAATGTPLSQIQAGVGTASTGSAQVYLDTNPINVTVNPNGTANPVSTSVGTSVNGRGRMASIQSVSSNSGSYSVAFSNTSVASGQMAVTMYAPGGNGNVILLTSNVQAICPSSSGSCGSYNYGTSPYGTGTYYLVFTPCGYTTSTCAFTPTPGPSWFSNLLGINTTFSTNVTATSY